MTTDRSMTLAARFARLTVAAIVVAAAGASFGHPAAPANASPPTALELAEHALSSTTMLADESPYELIDPVGPGGITRSQALNEVTASTMIGGLSSDNGRYGGGGYSQPYFMPVLPMRSGTGGYGRYNDRDETRDSR
ncbi:MAG: hypothetical protein M3Z41_03720 [Candidatus Eremiobacteraeota bacterium]|nr:hypothetical protein [Candidatus Eremiobacteraeota bacterium]